jgi:hypothetical protein
VPQLETPRTTPRWSRTILPAVLAILERIVRSRLGREVWRDGVGGITLLLRRGGRAVPAVVSYQTTKHCDGRDTTPIISYSILACRAWCCCFVSCRRKKCSNAANLSAIRGSAPPPKSWHCYPTSCTLPSLKLHNLLQNHTKMAARTSIARAARQFTSAAARRPSPFVCQRWAQASQKPRLFSVSAARMLTRCWKQQLRDGIEG